MFYKKVASLEGTCHAVHTLFYKPRIWKICKVSCVTTLPEYFLQTIASMKICFERRLFGIKIDCIQSNKSCYCYDKSSHFFATIRISYRVVLTIICIILICPG